MSIVEAEADAKSRRAVVIGATGATGREVVKALLERNWKVTTVSRGKFNVSMNISSDKIQNLYMIESKFDDIDLLTDGWKGHDALFNCIGTTRGQAGSAEAFVEVEVGITKIATSIAKKSGISHVALVSSQGANKDMWVPTTLIHPMLYIRTMGEKQQAVIDGNFPSTTIFQPGMLDRLVGDRMAENVITWLAPSIALRVDTLALAMVMDAERKLDRLATEQCHASDSGDMKSNSEGDVTYVTGNPSIIASIGQHP